MSSMARVLALVAALGLAAVPAYAPGPPAAAEAASAEQIFTNTCGFCHQNGGRAPGRGPKLSGTDRSDEYLLHRIRVGKEGAMPAYGRAFSEAQLRALVAYIRGLKDDGR
jgi:mono/diheme cytochrome c family protein